MVQDTYTRSNAVTEVALSRLSKAEYNRLLKCSNDRLERELYGQAVLDYLCGEFHIDGVKLHVTDKPQKTIQTRRGKICDHGFYITTRNITIYNTTAKIKKPVSIKRFTETLLHEFIHHYDHHYLKLGGSPHTSGFYYRLGDLQQKLKA